MERLRYLEGLVKDLRDQLQQARSSYSSSAGPSPGSNPHQDDQSGSHKSPEEAGELRKQFGRMIIQDSEQPRYVSSGFWSRIDDEVGSKYTRRGDHVIPLTHRSSTVWKIEVMNV